LNVGGVVVLNTPPALEMPPSVNPSPPTVREGPAAQCPPHSAQHMRMGGLHVTQETRFKDETVGYFEQSVGPTTARSLIPES